MQLPADFKTAETTCGMEGHTRPRGPSESPDGVDPNIRRTIKTQRDGHNMKFGVKIWSLCSVSSTLSHATLEQPFRTLAIKWEVNIFLKKSSCVLSSCVFLPASFCVRLYYWVVMIRQMSIQHIYIYIYIYKLIRKLNLTVVRKVEKNSKFDWIIMRVDVERFGLITFFKTLN